MRLQPREKTLLGIMFIVLFAVTAWLLIIEPLWQGYFRTAEAVQLLSTRLDNASQVMKNREEIQAEIEALTGALQLLRELPGGADIGALTVGRLQEAAQSLDLAFYEIKPSAKSNTALFTKTPLTVRGEGTYQALLDFLRNLQVLSPTLVVTRLQINSKSGSSGRVEFNLSVSALQYTAGEVSKK